MLCHSAAPSCCSPGVTALGGTSRGGGSVSDSLDVRFLGSVGDKQFQWDIHHVAAVGALRSWGSHNGRTDSCRVSAPVRQTSYLRDEESDDFLSVTAGTVRRADLSDEHRRACWTADTWWPLLGCLSVPLFMVSSARFQTR